MTTTLAKPVTRRMPGLTVNQAGRSHPVDLILHVGPEGPAIRLRAVRGSQIIDVPVASLIEGLSASSVISLIQAAIMTNPHHLPEVNQAAVDGIDRAVSLDVFDGPTIGEMEVTYEPEES